MVKGEGTSRYKRILRVTATVQLLASRENFFACVMCFNRTVQTSSLVLCASIVQYSKYRQKHPRKYPPKY